MSLTDVQFNALKNFHKESISCACDHKIFDGNGRFNYCDACKSRVLDFMSTYGLGVLCNDIQLEELGKENSRLKSENASLIKQLKEKVDGYNKLLIDTHKDLRQALYVIPEWHSQYDCLSNCVAAARIANKYKIPLCLVYNILDYKYELSIEEQKVLEQNQKYLKE